MGFTAGVTKNTGDLITAAIWNNYLGAAGSLDFLYGPHAVKVSHSSDQTADDGVETTLAFDTETFDTDSFHDTVTSNSRLTVPSGLAGIYLISGNVYWAGGMTPTAVDEAVVSALIKKNGSTYLARDRRQVADTYGVWQIVSCIAELAATDYVELCAYPLYIDDASGTISSGGTWFSMVWLGGPTA